MFLMRHDASLNVPNIAKRGSRERYMLTDLYRGPHNERNNKQYNLRRASWKAISVYILSPKTTMCLPPITPVHRFLSAFASPKATTVTCRADLRRMLHLLIEKTRQAHKDQPVVVVGKRT